jgi:hypothetical protein
MKDVKEAMPLHHHPHSLLSKNLWCSSTESFLLKFFKACPCRHPFWRGSLSCVSHVSTVTTIILHPIGGTSVTTITLHLIGCIIISGDGGGRSRGVPSKSWCSFNVGIVILACLLFFLGVIEDDDVVITGWP